MSKKVFPIFKTEVGILLSRSDEEYNCYNEVYDKKHSFYDENVAFFMNKEDAISYANSYIEDGVPRTYGIVSELIFDGSNLDDDELDEIVTGINECGNLEEYDEYFSSEEMYGIDNVIYNSFKIRKSKREIF